MASSSDWVSALAEMEPVAGPAAPNWIEALGAVHSFVAGFPARDKPEEPKRADAQVPPPAPAPDSPDPVAEAFAQGEAGGRAAAAAEYRAEQEKQRGLRLNFRALDQAAMDSLASELSNTVIALCEAAIAGFTPDPQSLSQRCQEAARRIGSPSDAEDSVQTAYLSLLHKRDAAFDAPILPWLIGKSRWIYWPTNRLTPAAIAAASSMRASGTSIRVGALQL